MFENLRASLSRASAGSWLRALLLAGLLATHFGSRYHAHRTIPLAERGFNTYVYRVSLALLAGDGFQTYRFSQAPPTAPVAEFLNLQRPRLAPAEFAAFLAGPDARPLAHPFTDIARPFPLRDGDENVIAEPHYTTRVLDVYTAALIWKVFGIRWEPLFIFYALVSTGACLMVFAVGRRLGGGFGAGLLAGLFYLTSPLEQVYAVRSLRDISPLWFAALGFAAWLYLADRFRSRAANAAAAFAVGVLSALGCGWRSDALLLAPFLLTCLVLRRRGWRATAAAALTFVAGVIVTHVGIGLLAGGGPRMSPLTGFQIAYYGESVRCNFLGVEDTCQVSRDDVQACADAQHYRDVHSPGAPPMMYLISPEYGGTCARVYGEAVSHNLYRIVAGFPWFYRDCFRACRLEALPVNGDYYPAPVAPPDGVPGRAWTVLQSVSGWALPLFALGALAAIATGARPFESAALLAFSVYQAAALFAVLPEHKHAGTFVLPLSVFAGIGVLTVARLIVAPRRALAAWSAAGPRLRRVGVVALVLLAGWGTACGGARWYSGRVRATCLADIEALAPRGTPAPEAVRDDRLVSIHVPADPSAAPVGYLLRLRAGREGAALTCRHVRFPRYLLGARVHVTRHQLHPDREQFFFVTCFQEARHGDPRPLACTVRLEGDARVLGCVRLDLSAWRDGPMSTVFYPGQRAPGNPRVGGPSSRTWYALPEAVDGERLEAEE